MKKTCNCCEGIHKITPSQIANRPGLFALQYRVGTHATFFETMKAQLSNFYLEVEESRERRLTSGKPVIYPLRELRTRAANDPAIAMLDAWATIADVLTFYQERIANEGYLRTATERRSILELARLVGYALRPGVAASTFLAYTLDKEIVVTIPAGSRAQSVPGPGETLQAFETSDDLRARTEWNVLQPRLTRPQSPDTRGQVDGKGLYLKGVSTNLKPNDALLLDFGGRNPTQELYRVMEVELDAVAVRTKVSLQPWTKVAVEQEAALPRAQSEGFTSFFDAAPLEFRANAERVQEIVERNSNREQMGDLLKTRTGSKVLEQLDSLSGSPPVSGVELAELINEQVLPALNAELRAAQEGRFTRLTPWIEQLIMDLEDALEIAPAKEAEEAATNDFEEAAAINDFGAEANFALPSPSSNTDAADRYTIKKPKPVKSDMEYLLDSLEKPASIPPANPSRLDRSLDQSFSENSDITPNLLTALRPGLARLLLKAIGNLPVSQPTTAKIYAMRTRASVFGHNAPMRNVTDDNGKVIGQKEWTLTRLGETGTEDFLLELKIFVRSRRPPGSPHVNEPLGSPPSGNPFQAMCRTRIKIGDFSEIVHPSPTTGEPFTPHDFLINYVAAKETPIKGNVNVPPPPPGGELGSVVPPCILTYKLALRPITVTIDLRQLLEPQVTSTGLDPATFKFSFSFLASKVPEKSSLAVNRDFIETSLTLLVSGKALSVVATENPFDISLDAPYPQILPSVDERQDAPQSWFALERPDPSDQKMRVIISRILQVKEASRADYGIALKGTQLKLKAPWLNPKTDAQGKPINELDLLENDFRAIRSSTIFAQSELLELDEAPIDPLANPICGSEIELDGFYSGLEAGRWLIITGERADITPSAPTEQKTLPGKIPVPEPMPVTGMGTETETKTEAEKEKEKPPVILGLKSAELVMLAGLRHKGGEKDKITTTLLLANKLAYCYKLDTVTIYGNVAHATHGETRNEVLGSGDASLPLQTFTLKQPPLTFVSAPTISGIDTTLQVRVNDILWHETESFAELGPKDRSYLTRTDEEGKTKVIFGNGEKGARPATGIENLTALYRNGIGRAGNLKAEQISLLATKPLGVKEVINPLPATGGADKEDRDTARRNTPLAVMSLDRLVSVQDYEDFTRTFAGIGKASAARLSDGRRQIVFLTIAGADDIPIAETSDLYQNLRLALHKFGDPFQAVQIKKRLLKLLVMSAGVHVNPDYLWEKVEPKVREALLDKFSFTRRELGQDALLSEAISAMQAVEGVVYVDVDSFGAVDESITSTSLPKLLETFKENVKKGRRVIARMAKVDENEVDPDKRISPAELILMSPKVTDTLILKEVKA